MHEFLRQLLMYSLLLGLLWLAKRLARLSEEYFAVMWRSVVGAVTAVQINRSIGDHGFGLELLVYMCSFAMAYYVYDLYTKLRRG